jgi:hypothetical protein
METCRQYWWNLNGRCRLNFNWDAIDHDSVVLISASEYRPDGGDPSHSPRFVGDARIRVLNVSPHSPPFDPNHGVTFVVNVDWGSPLHVVTDITVLDAKPVDTLWNGNLLAFTTQHQQQNELVLGCDGDERGALLRRLQHLDPVPSRQQPNRAHRLLRPRRLDQLQHRPGTRQPSDHRRPP